MNYNHIVDVLLRVRIVYPTVNARISIEIRFQIIGLNYDKIRSTLHAVFDRKRVVYVPYFSTEVTIANEASYLSRKRHRIIVVLYRMADRVKTECTTLFTYRIWITHDRLRIVSFDLGTIKRGATQN